MALLAAGPIVALPVFWVWFAGQSDRPALLGVKPADLRHLVESRPSALAPLLWAMASAALLVFWAMRRPGRVSQALAAALLLADMGSYAVSYQPTTDAALFERRPDVLAALGGDGQPFRKATFLTGTNELPTRTAQETLAVSWAMVYGVEDINGFNSLQPRRYTDYLFGPDVGDVSYGYLANAELLKPGNPVLAALNVRFLLVPVNMQQPPFGAHLREVYRSPEVRVYENTLVWPRAFFAGRARAEADPRAILRAVTATGFDARRETLVEGALPDGLASTPGASTARVVRHEPNRQEIAVDTDAARLLVLSEMFFPGWRATIDGAEAPILRANYLFRAVAVPPGAHTVTLEYRPRSAQIGLVVTLAGLCVGGWLALRGRRASFLT